MQTAPPLLLNPGPVTLSARVRAALTRPDVCHREPEYAALQLAVQGLLQAVYPAAVGYQALLLAGSGTAAVEAMVGSLLPKGSRTLVLANGVYGERIAAMLAAQGKAHQVLVSPWTSSFELQAVEQALDADPALGYVVAVHHETTTGRLNPVAQLGALCKRRGVKLLLDAVSSFGAEAIAFEAWNLEACAATANKCLHGAPGTAFVLARAAAFDEHPTGATSVYLDLYRYRAGHASGVPPFTPAIPSLYALAEALAEHAEAGGRQARQALYRARGEQVRLALTGLGVDDFLQDPTAYSSALTAYTLPAGVSYEELHAQLKAAGFVIYAGQGGFAGRIFRIATMGELAASDIDRLVAALTVAFTPVAAAR